MHLNGCRIIKNSLLTKIWFILKLIIKYFVLKLSQEVNRIGHIALRVENLERAKSFYIKLGMNLVWDDKDWSYLEAGKGKDGLALLGPSYKAAGPHFAFHFENKKEVENIQNDLKNNKNIEYKIETKAGLKIAKYINDEITVKMGVPILESQNIPTTIEKKINSIPSHEFIEKNFNNIGYAVGMGNPHLIFFVQDIESIALSRLGPIFEKNELFPEKTNVHFCQIINKENIKVKVWERGAGPTLACGTGACAIHVAAYKLGLCNSKTIVSLPGGNLKIDWTKDGCEVMMTGNAKKVFSGSMLVN